MAKIKDAPRDPNSVVKAKTKVSGKPVRGYAWWNAKNREELRNQVLDTASYLKTNQQWRFRQAAIYARLYGNRPIANFMGSSMSKGANINSLPIDRPTMNVIQSCVDTKVSRITQSRPRPIFLTDNGDYKERNLAKKLNQFVVGELYRTKAYELGEFLLRDADALGTGCVKILETPDHKIALERNLLTELLVDEIDGYYGDPRTMYQFKLVDRSILAESHPSHKSDIAKAEQGYLDNSSEAQMTTSDQVLVCEAWHLPSGKDSGDGRHVIVCTSGVLLDREYTKEKFPFVFLHSSPGIVGFWGQGCPERLMGTQVEINKLLMTISQSISLVGVPRVFVEDGSKVVKAHLNNQVGSIVTYRGTKPVYEVAPCVPQEMYAQLQRLIQYAYQQEGISELAAGSQKPAGLSSGEALREYNDTQTDRLAALAKRYDNMFIDLAYQIIDLAKDIVEREGKYLTVYPNKDGTKEIDLPAAELLKNPFIIQCFDASSLPRDPAGRLQKVTEMMQAGIISPQEGRRLLDYPDIEQVDKLANSSEERILKILDKIVEDGEFTPPDPFMDLNLAQQLVTQYYNLYIETKLEEEKAQLLRDFFSQIQALKAAAQPPAPPQMPQAGPQAVPQARPQSDVLPNVPQQ